MVVMDSLVHVDIHLKCGMFRALVQMITLVMKLFLLEQYNMRLIRQMNAVTFGHSIGLYFESIDVIMAKRIVWTLEEDVENTIIDGDN